MKILNNKNILITGASSGIGQACARLLAREGARLILTARRVERLTALQKELQTQYNTDCFLLPLDVRSRQQVQSQLQSLPAVWQSIDILINNAFLACYLKKKYPAIRYLIGHNDYLQFKNTALWLEKDPNYQTDKKDPGLTFVAKVKKAIANS